jgi:hypothetical protein
LVAAASDARKATSTEGYRVEDGLVMQTLDRWAKRPHEDCSAALVPPGAAWLREAAPAAFALARLGLERWRRGEAGELELSYL